MTDEATFDPAGFASSFKGFMDTMRHAAPEQEPPLLRRMREHFGADPAALPIVSEKWKRAVSTCVKSAIRDLAGVHDEGRHHARGQ